MVDLRVVRYTVVLTVAVGCGGATTTTTSVSQPAPAEWDGRVTSAPVASGVQGAYHRMTTNEVEGFPCSLSFANGVVSRACSPGNELAWGTYWSDVDGTYVQMEQRLVSGYGVVRADNEPARIAIDATGSRLRLRGACWGGQLEHAELDRRGVSLTGVWQRVEDAGSGPSRLLFRPGAWRELPHGIRDGTNNGELEVVEDRDGVLEVRLTSRIDRGEDTHVIEMAADRSSLTLDGARYVRERGPIIVCPSNAEVAVGQSTTIEIGGDDPDGGDLGWYFRVTGSPRGSAVASSTDNVSTTFVPDVAGEYSFLATATDDEGGTATCTPHVVAVE